MPITRLPTGRAAGPEPSGPPAARAGAPPGFLAALDTAAQTWTALAEGHSHNTSGSRNDSAISKANVGRAADAVRPARSSASSAAEHASNAKTVTAAPRGFPAVPSNGASSDAADSSHAADAKGAGELPPTDDVAPTDAPVADATATLALLGLVAVNVTAMTVQSKIPTADAPIAASVQPAMVGASPAELAAAAQLPAPSITAADAAALSAPASLAEPAAQVAIPSPAAQALPSAVADAAAAKLGAAGKAPTAPAGSASVAGLLAAVAPTGAPAKLPAADLQALLDRATAEQAAAATAASGLTPIGAAQAAAAALAAGGTKVPGSAAPAQAATPAPGTKAEASAATLAAPADPGVVAPTAGASTVAPAPAPVTAGSAVQANATPADNAAAALAAAQAQLAAPAPIAAVTPPLTPLAQAIQAAAQQQSGSGGAPQGDSGAQKGDHKDASAAAVTAAATNPADAGAPLAGTQQVAGVVSTPAAPAVPTIQAPNPGAQAAAIEALINLTRKDGASAARIKLAPESLGGIQVTLTFGTGGVTAKLIADRPEAAAALSQAGNDLRDSLQSQGIDLASLETGFAGSMGQQGDQRSAQNFSEFGAGASNSGTRNADDLDTTIHLALDDQPAAQQPLAAGRTIDLRA